MKNTANIELTTNEAWPLLDVAVVDVKAKKKHKKKCCKSYKKGKFCKRCPKSFA